MDEKLGPTSPSQPAQESASYSRNRSPLSDLFGKFTGLFSNKTTAIAGILVLVLGLGAATIAVQRSTEIRQRAAGGCERLYDSSCSPDMANYCSSTTIATSCQYVDGDGDGVSHWCVVSTSCSSGQTCSSGSCTNGPTIAGHVKNSVTGAGINGVEIQVYDDGLKASKYPHTNSSGYWEIANWARTGDCYAVRVSGNLASPQTAPAGYAPPAKTTTSGWTWQGYCGGSNADTSVGSQSYEYQKAGTNDCATDPDGSGPITTARCDFAYAPTPAPSQTMLLVKAADEDTGTRITNVAITGTQLGTSGSTPYNVTISPINTTLTAPPTAGGKPFRTWFCPLGSLDIANRTCTENIPVGVPSREVSAMYGISTIPTPTPTPIPIPGRARLSVGAQDGDTSTPISGVLISGTQSGTGGTTLYNFESPSSISTTLTAPPNANGKPFERWAGCDSTTGQQCTVNVTVGFTKISVAIYKSAPCVTLYQNINYGGGKININTKLNPDFTLLKFDNNVSVNDNVSSIVIGPKVAVYLWRDKNYSPANAGTLLINSTPDFTNLKFANGDPLNDNASSMIADGCSGAPSPTPTVTPAPSGNSISGTVFIDINANGTLDSGEAGYNSQGALEVFLYRITGGNQYSLVGDIPTDSSGYYAFQNLLVGTYELGYRVVSGYIQTTSPGIFNTTVPPNRVYNFGLLPTPDCNAGQQCTACVAPANTCSGSGTQTCTLTRYQSGNFNTTTCNRVNNNVSCNNAPANCNAGRICQNNVCVAPTSAPTATPTPTGTQGGPTATPTPTGTSGGTQLALTVGLHGIGTVGDNASSDASAANRSPQHTTRAVTVEIYNSQNSLVTTKNGTVTYSSSLGLFTGTVDLGSIASGGYTAKVKSDGYLRRKVPGIVTLTVGQTYQAPRIDLVVGDLNNDNALDILDYNILKACINNNSSVYSSVCTTSYRTLSDLNDNGVIDLFDYNLFLRELSVQNGE